MKMLAGSLAHVSNIEHVRTHFTLSGVRGLPKYISCNNFGIEMNSENWILTLTFTVLTLCKTIQNLKCTSLSPSRKHKHRICGSSIVSQCLPRGRGSAPCPYQCRVMLVFPAGNKSRRWHRMSAASCAGTPSVYPLPAPSTPLHGQRKCCLKCFQLARLMHLILHEIKHSCKTVRRWLGAVQLCVDGLFFKVALEWH